MNVMVCDGVWEGAGQALVFVRTLCTAALSETSPAGLTAEDHAPTREHRHLRQSLRHTGRQHPYATENLGA